MIANDDELKGTRDRIAHFEDLLAQMRVAARPDLFPSMAGGYRAEIEKMEREILDYLTRHRPPMPMAIATALSAKFQVQRVHYALRLVTSIAVAHFLLPFLEQPSLQ